MDNLDQRLENALSRRSGLETKKQRLEGQLEAARKALKAIEEECHSRGIPPEKLDATIEQLSQRYREMVESLETGVDQAEQALQPFLKED